MLSLRGIQGHARRAGAPPKVVAFTGKRQFKELLFDYPQPKGARVDVEYGVQVGRIAAHAGSLVFLFGPQCHDVCLCLPRPCGQWGGPLLKKRSSSLFSPPPQEPQPCATRYADTHTCQESPFLRAKISFCLSEFNYHR